MKFIGFFKGFPGFRSHKTGNQLQIRSAKSRIMPGVFGPSHSVEDFFLVEVFCFDGGFSHQFAHPIIREDSF